MYIIHDQYTYIYTYYTSLLNTCMTYLAHNSHVWTNRKKKTPLHAFKDHLLQPRAAALARSLHGRPGEKEEKKREPDPPPLPAPHPPQIAARILELLGPRPPGARRPAGTRPPCPSSPSAAFPRWVLRRFRLASPVRPTNKGGYQL